MNIVGFSPGPHFWMVVGKVGLLRSTTAQHASSCASVVTIHPRAARVPSGETATTCAGSRRRGARREVPGERTLRRAAVEVGGPADDRADLARVPTLADAPCRPARRPRGCSPVPSLASTRVPSGDTAYAPDAPRARTVRPAGERISISLCDEPVDRWDWRTKPPFARTARLSTTVPFSRWSTVLPKRIVSSRAYASARVATDEEGAVGAAVEGRSVGEVVVVVGAVVGTEPVGEGSEAVAVGRAGTGGVLPRLVDHRIGTPTATTATAAAATTTRARWSRRRLATATGAKSPDTSTPAARCRSRACSSFSFSWSVVVTA